jgi:hypothetical protein
MGRPDKAGFIKKDGNGDLMFVSSELKQMLRTRYLGCLRGKVGL